MSLATVQIQLVEVLAENSTSIANLKKIMKTVLLSTRLSLP